MAAQRCPACGLINPATALRCDCGRSFKDGTMGESLDQRLAESITGPVCPKCRKAVAPRSLGFTWWGGLVGPRLLDHVECPACGARYNGKTRRSNDTAIAIYLVVHVVLIAVVYTLLRS